MELTEAQHLKAIHGKGDLASPGGWNDRWATFINTNRQASPREFYQFAGKLMDEYGLSGLKIVPYRK